jgi:hypothetical protein
MLFRLVCEVSIHPFCPIPSNGLFAPVQWFPGL